MISETWHTRRARQLDRYKAHAEHVMQNVDALPAAVRRVIYEFAGTEAVQRLCQMDVSRSEALYIVEAVQNKRTSTKLYQGPDPRAS